MGFLVSLSLARFSVDVGRIVNLKLPMTIAAKPVLSLPVDSTRLAKQEIKIIDDNKKTEIRISDFGFLILIQK